MKIRQRKRRFRKHPFPWVLSWKSRQVGMSTWVSSSAINFPRCMADWGTVKFVLLGAEGRCAGFFKLEPTFQPQPQPSPDPRVTLSGSLDVHFPDVELLRQFQANILTTKLV